jgi:hypothetical protein
VNNRKLKKRNRKLHEEIVSKLPFTLTNHTFGSGYFIFDMGANSVSWFWLKELPGWKFGIWLGKNSSFEIFGQAISMIDKFKPSRSELSHKDDLAGFVKDVCNIIDRHPDWKEYLDSAEEADLYEKRKRKFEQEVYQIMFDTSKSISSDLLDIRIEDQNTKSLRVSPRYRVKEYVESDDLELSNDGLISSIKNYEILCRSLSDLDEADIEEFSYRDTYLFWTLGQSIVAPEEYNRDANLYKWNAVTFDEHLKEIYDDNQEWKISTDQLKYILWHWKKDNYPDSPTIPGFLDALKRCYDGQYNPWVAKKLIYGMFDYNRTFNWLTDYKSEKNN